MNRVGTILGMTAAVLALSACSKKGSETPSNETGATATAAASKMPKAGLWEMKLAAAGMPQTTTSKVCVGETPAGTNPFKLQSNAAAGACAKNDIKETATGYEINTECASNGMTIATTGTVSGDFEKAYKIDMSTKMTGANIPAAAQKETKTTIEATYLGECPAGMSPGQTG